MQTKTTATPASTSMFTLPASNYYDLQRVSYQSCHFCGGRTDGFNKSWECHWSARRMEAIYSKESYAPADAIRCVSTSTNERLIRSPSELFRWKNGLGARASIYILKHVDVDLSQSWIKCLRMLWLHNRWPKKLWIFSSRWWWQMIASCRCRRKKY